MDRQQTRFTICDTCWTLYESGGCPFCENESLSEPHTGDFKVPPVHHQTIPERESVALAAGASKADGEITDFRALGQGFGVMDADAQREVDEWANKELRTLGPGDGEAWEKLKTPEAFKLKARDRTWYVDRGGWASPFPYEPGAGVVRAKTLLDRRGGE